MTVLLIRFYTKIAEPFKYKISEGQSINETWLDKVRHVFGGANT